MSMKEETRGYLYLMISSLLFALVGIFVKLTAGINPLELTFFRGTITIGLVFAFAVATRRLKELTLASPLPTLLVGICEGLSVYLFFFALQKTTVANAIFLVYSAPFFSVLLAKFFLKEKIEKTTIIGLIATMIGVFLLADPRRFSFASSQHVGNIAALGAGFLYALMAFFAKPLLSKASGQYVVFWQYFVIALMFGFFLPEHSFSHFVSNWWQVSAMGLVSTVLAMLLFMEGVKRVKAQKIFIVTSIEPVLATLFAFIILGETPVLATLLGGIIIFFGVYQITRRKTE